MPARMMSLIHTNEWKINATAVPSINNLNATRLIIMRLLDQFTCWIKSHAGREVLHGPFDKKYFSA